MVLLGRNLFEREISWIAPESVSERKNVHFRARRNIFRDAFGDGKLSIAAESYYALWVNGEFVANGPARGTYSCNFIDEYDIDVFLQDGENIIAVEVFCNNYPTFIASPSQPALLVKVGDVITDESWDVQIASDWRDDVPKYTLQIGSMEFRDMRLEPQGWQVCQDNSEWQQAVVLASDLPIYSKDLFVRDVCDLEANVLLPVKVPVISSVSPLADLKDVNVAEIIGGEAFGNYEGEFSEYDIVAGNPAKIMPQPDGGGVAVIFDFGQAIIGGISLDLESQDGMAVDVCYGESIENGKINPLRHHYRFADRYILRSGRQTVSNPLHFRGGRYVQLIFRDFNVPITINKFEFIDRRYPIDSPNKFECDNKMLNSLWDKSLATMSACATDTFLDCPWREMSFWVNDFVVQQEFWHQLVGRPDLVKRSLSLALSQPASNGLVPGVCPSDGDDHYILFPTNLFLPIILKDFERYSADGDYVVAVLPEIEKIFNICHRYADGNNLLDPPVKYWNFTDWSYALCMNIEHFDSEEYPLNGRNTCIVNWFFCLAADALAELYIDRDNDKSQKYVKLAKKISTAIVEKFWNENLTCFNEFIDQDGPASKISHALGILSGRLPEKFIQPCSLALSRDDCLTPEFYMMHYVFKALAITNNYDGILRLIKEYWQPNVDSDCPTIWEANVYQTGSQAFSNAGSMCHAFSLAPVSFFQQEILGIKPLKKGFEIFSVNPCEIGLNNACGTINTPKGVIEMSWKKYDEGLKVNIVIPDGLQAVCHDGKVLFNGLHEFIIQGKKR